MEFPRGGNYIRRTIFGCYRIENLGKPIKKVKLEKSDPTSIELIDTSPVVSKAVFRPLAPCLLDKVGEAECSGFKWKGRKSNKEGC